MSTELTTQTEMIESTTEISHAWNSPKPLTKVTAKENQYPMDALPSIAQKAVSAYHQYGQQPLSLIANSALAAH